MTADKYVVMFKFGASTASIVFASNTCEGAKKTHHAVHMHFVRMMSEIMASGQVGKQTLQSVVKRVNDDCTADSIAVLTCELAPIKHAEIVKRRDGTSFVAGEKP